MDTGWVNILFAKSLAIGNILSWFSFISYSVYFIKKLWNKYFLNIANTLKVITYLFIYQESNASITSFKINRLLNLTRFTFVTYLCSSQILCKYDLNINIFVRRFSHQNFLGLITGSVCEKKLRLRKVGSQKLFLLCRSYRLSENEGSTSVSCTQITGKRIIYWQNKNPPMKINEYQSWKMIYRL